MESQGRQEFLAGEGVDDWVVLHGGPTAVFLTASMVEAAQLAAELANLAGFDSDNSQLNIVSNRLTVRLTREVWKTSREHVDLARAISEVARLRGAVADRGRVQEVQLAIAAKPDQIDLNFWRAVLGYEPMLGDNAVDPLGNSSTVWMQELDASKPLRHAMHVDVSVAREAAESRVQEAIAAGGILVDGSHAPEWWILADRSGNKVCVAAWPDRAE